MDNFQKEFVMAFFVDNDNLTTVNRSIMAMTNLLFENVENLDAYNEVISREKLSEIIDNSVVEPPLIQDYYEQAVVNFSDEDYEATFKAKKTTVQVRDKMFRYLTRLI